MSAKLQHTKLYTQIIDLLQSARNQMVVTVNKTMVITYFEIGRMIIEEEQDGEDRATYGKQLLKGLSNKLTHEFGKGFSVDNLQNMRRFFIAYKKYETVSHNYDSLISKTQFHQTNKTKPRYKVHDLKLSWSHYLKLIRIDDEAERNFYEIEASKNNWSVRELKRQYDSALFTRLPLSRNKSEIKRLSEKGLLIQKPKDAIKDPYILEFIGLPEHTSYSENDLEQAPINKLEHFLLEFGSGFTFVARQKRIYFDDKHFRIDLVFYNRFLKAFVLIDLKIGVFKHQDLGQMQMYVNYYDREIKLEDKNKTIGMILCQNKSDSVVKYTLPEHNEHIFASKYKTILPSKTALKNLLEEPSIQYLNHS